jgi:glycerol-3-phosphate dehydrogenase (NAD(P)+)
VGERLGRGEKMDAILTGMKQVVEGVTNCVTARELARELGVAAPITDEVYAVVMEGKDPRTAVSDLLARDPRPERDPQAG